MTAVWIVLTGVIALALGGAVGFLAAERRGEATRGEATRARDEADRLAGEIDALRDEAGEQRARADSAAERAARLEEQKAADARSFAEQKATLADAEARLRETFGGLASRSLSDNNERFLALAKERFTALRDTAAGDLDKRKAEIDGLLKPIREVLDAYQKRLGEVEKRRDEDKQALAATLGKISTAHDTLATQTSQLVTALSRPNTRGRWGEVQLDRILELSGMHEGSGYSKQVTTTDADGDAVQRPDVVVTMPGGRTCVIDSKFPGDAFMDAVAESDAAQRERLMDVHVKQVADHARQLGRKSYWERFADSPEYVVMFIPAEAFLYAAVERDGDLLERALGDRVILATPTTLIALLKAVEFGWRQERMHENAEEIRRLGVLLHERIAVFAGHLQKVGKQLDGAVRAYNTGVGSMDRMLASAARDLAELGSRGGKEVPEVSALDRTARESKLLPGGQDVDSEPSETTPITRVAKAGNPADVLT